MAQLCIPQEKINELRKALKAETDLSSFINKSHEELVNWFSKFAPDEAENLATLFESKIILKGRARAITYLFKKLAGLGKFSEEGRIKLEQAKKEFEAEQQRRIFNPNENESYLEGLAKKIVGAEITREQAKELYNLQAIANQALNEFNPETKQWSSEEARALYGAAAYNVMDFTKKLSLENITIKEMILNRSKEFKEQWAESKDKSIWKLIVDSLNFISQNSISIVASIDASFTLRQGLKTLLTNPKLWLSETKKGFSVFYNTLKGENVESAFWASVLSDPLYLDGTYEKMGILESKREEQFQSGLPARIPLLGRMFKASENMFVFMAKGIRMGLAKSYLQNAKNAKIELDEKQLKSLGIIINSLTARGQWGKRGEPAIVRMILWAPKMIKGNIDVLTAHLGQDITPYAKKIAAQNLLKIVGITALFLMMAKAIDEDSVEFDPRSTDFGKIKAGNTRFDITGGAASLITLASRVAANSYKSTISGEVIKFGTGYGEKTRFDILMDFLTGKTAPLPRLAIDLMKGQNFEGKPVTVSNALMSLAVPISIQNVIDLKDDNSASAVLGILTDALGINATTYTAEKDWSINPSKSISAFREKVGDTKFKEANKKYNEEFNKWFEIVKKDIRYQALTQEQRQQVVSNKKLDLQEKIMRQYGFVYKKQKATKLPKF